MTTTTSNRSSRSYPAGTDRQRAVRIPTDSGAEVFGLDAGAAGLQAAVGCRLVDVLALDGGVDLWVDEEGLLQAAPLLNLPATLLAHAGGVHTAIFGTAVAVSVDPVTGETLGLTLEQAEQITALLAAATPAVVAVAAATISGLLPALR